MTDKTQAPRLTDSKTWTFLYWLCQVLGWGVYSLVGDRIAQQQAGGALGGRIHLGYVLFFLYSIGLSHAFGRLIERRQWLELAPLAAMLRVVGGVVALATMLAALVVVVGVTIGGMSLGALPSSFLFYLWFNVAIASAIWTAFYVTIAALFRSFRAKRRSEALEHAVTSARLRLLVSQVSPHFLFNSLNSIRALISENPSQAQDMVTRLANLLRHSLQRDALSLIPLKREQEVVEDYLALEGVRFEDRLRVERSLAANTLNHRVPAMTLQLLVENAVKHGLSPLPAGGVVTLSSRLDGNALRIEVTNTGRLGGNASAESTGIGLANLRERLKLLCGADATLDLQQRSPDVVAATVVIPQSSTASPT